MPGEDSKKIHETFSSAHCSLSRLYPDRDDTREDEEGHEINPCEFWDTTGMTQDMYILGSVLLHEYT